MDRSRGTRRLNMAAAAAGGVSTELLKRRHRTTPLRDSPEAEDDEMQQEIGRFRDRGSKRERDHRDLFNNKRTRGTSREGYEDDDGTTDDEYEHESVAKMASFMVADEVIAITVPRKARSASAKRLQHSWVKSSDVSVSVKKKTKRSGPKTRLRKVSLSKSRVQEDIEIEIAEVLFGLKKQSSSKEEHKLQSKDTNGQTTVLALNCGPVRVASKEQRMEGDDSDVPIQDSSVVSSVKEESHLPKDMELVSSKLKKTSAEQSEVSQDMGGSKVTSTPAELQEETIRQGNSKSVVEESVFSSAKEESASCSNLNVDLQDSSLAKVTSNVSEIDGQCEDNLKIDLMSPPPAASSPEPGGCNLSSDPKPTSEDEEMKTENLISNEKQVERLMKEPILVEHGDKQIKAEGDKPELRLNLEKLKHESSNDDNTKIQQNQQAKTTTSKLEPIAQYSSVPLPFAVPSWPNSLPPIGYMPPSQTVIPMDGTAESSTALQPPHFVLSRPRLKRCATHHHIASNIRVHQQLTKMNPLWPAAASSASLRDSKSNAMHSMDGMIIGNSMQGNFPVANTNTAEDKGQVVANIPVFTGKDKSPEGAKFVDTAHKRQIVFHQSLQPAPACNWLNGGPAFIFSLAQHQAPAVPIGSQSGPPKLPASINSAPFSSKAVAGVATNSPTLPPVAAAMSFSYPNIAANEAPYLTILPNNGYPFPVTASFGSPQTLKGGNSAQALPLYNGSFYSSQMLHPAQLQQQHSHSQSLVLPVYQNASSLSGSSSHKQLQPQQPHGTQVGANNFSITPSVQSQQQHVLSHQSRKLETDMSRESTQTTADTRASHSQKSVQVQNFMLPLQSNISLLPYTDINGSGNLGEKQQSQEKSLKGVPSQAFAMSFASVNGGNTPSNLNFLDMTRNPAIFQSLPEMKGYQVISAPHSKQKKSHQISEGKTGGSSSNPDDRKKVMLEKASNIGQTLVFDNSARTLNFVSSPFTGNWPSCSITPTTNVAVAVNASNSQQNELIQLQKQNFLPQQHPNGASESKTSGPHSSLSSSAGYKILNNAPIFTRSQAQNSSSPQSSHRTSSPKTLAAQASQTPLIASNRSTLKNVTQHQGRATQTQISFGESNLTPQGKQMPPNSQSSSQLVAASLPSGSNLRTTTNAKAANSSVTLLQSQPSDNSLTGNGQKSSPICGRDVPSILSTCPTRLSELKY